MRLLKRNDRGDFVFTAVLYSPPPYAILSHTWSTTPNAEVSYQDMLDGSAREKESFAKVRFMAERAEAESIEHFWIDNCCIDKRNDAEVSTAIRSMYKWYRDAAVCFVYLADVSLNKRDRNGQRAWEGNFRNCRWFTRGWTLQELIAPKRVEFYARGEHLGNRASLLKQIQEVTGIETDALLGTSHEKFPISTRLRWATGRMTTVPEDYFYALMGLCDVVMSPMYGEGSDWAEKRLKKEIREHHGEAALGSPMNLGSREPREIRCENAQQREWNLDMLRFETIHSRKANIRTEMKKTCSWILQHPTYLAWRDTEPAEEHCGFFWIKGKPGAGKSVLVKYLDTHVSTNQKPDVICISFYFNARGERLEKSLEGMYRSLLVQLLERNRELQPVVSDSRQIAGDGLLSLHTLSSLLSAAVMKLQSHRLYCFIDALDECQDSDMKQMVTFFWKLCEEAAKEGRRVSVCFASRHYPSFDIPTEFKLVLEDLDEHRNDLSKYVESQKFTSGSSNKLKNIPDQVQNTILAKANGVFLWVVLVVEILKTEYVRGNAHTVKQTLEQIPGDLTKLFRSIVTRDQENVHELLLCLRWILYSRRPLALREFYFAMLAGTDTNDLEWRCYFAEFSEEDADDMILDYLRSCSKGLAELTKGKNGRVQFIHESVRDFLVTGGGFEHIEPTCDSSAYGAHEALKQCCIRGIQIDMNICWQMMGLTAPADQDITAWRPSHRRSERALLKSGSPFLDYAIAMVFYHSNEAVLGIPQEGFFDRFDLSRWYTIANLLQQYDIGVYTPDVSIEYILAERNCANLIRSPACRQHDFTQSSRNRNRTPLIAALANKSKEAAEAILEREGAENPTKIAQEVIVDKYRGRQAYDLRQGQETWRWAIEQGWLSLARHLLRDDQLDAKVLRALSKFLYSVSETGIIDIATLLIERGADVNAQGGRYGNALQAASLRGYTEVATLLIERGADINAQGGLFGNALQAALIYGHTEVATLLIERGADVNAQGGRYGNALQAASLHGYIEVATLLIERGADVNAQGGDRGNALRAASAYGHTEVATLLIERGADVNAGGWYGTALQAASAHGYMEVATLLIERGTDVNAGSWYGTALQAASLHGHTEVATLLIERGADVNAQGGQFGTALQAASFHGYTEVATLLIERGADVNAQGGRYGTALQAACSRGHSGIATLLINCSTDVNTQGGK